ncbi:MAG: hypothetical protein HYZ18_14060 [Pseudogulbenkiania sp.]|nr:hypothetical protein [Pseudogulbenkiania sp.]
MLALDMVRRYGLDDAPDLAVPDGYSTIDDDGLDEIDRKRKRADEIEREVASGQMDAFQCFTQMRQLIDTAPPAVAGSEDLVDRICDALQIGRASRSPTVIRACIENSIRRSDCLGRIEDELTITGIDEETGEPFEESLLCWGEGPDDYIKRFREALKAKAAVAVPDEWRDVVTKLIVLASEVYLALENSEELCGEDGRFHKIDSIEFDAVCTALDALDDLPDDKPGYALGPAGKAEWALRAMFAAGPKPEGGEA